MSETASFFAGCATVGVAIVLFVGGDLRGQRPPQVQQHLPQSSTVPQPSISISPPPTQSLPSASDRQWEKFLEEFEEQQEVTEELYSRLDEQQAVTQKLAEQLEAQGSGLKEQQENADKIVGLFEEQHSHTKEMVGLFEEQRSQTDQIEALVAEQQGLITSLGEQSASQQERQLTTNRFQWASAPLFATIAVALVVIAALIGLMVLLIIAILIQSKKRPRTIHRTYHVPPRLALPTRAEEIPEDYPPEPFYPEYSDVYYQPPGRYVRRVTPLNNISDVSGR